MMDGTTALPGRLNAEDCRPLARINLHAGVNEAHSLMQEEPFTNLVSSHRSVESCSANL